MKRVLAGLVLLAVLPIRVSGAEPPARIAILDSGLWSGWASHPEFRSTSLVAWHDFQGDSPIPLDPTGHGTAVASLAVGATLGTAPRADLIVGRVLDQANTTTWEIVVEAMRWAVSSGADVINISIFSSSLQAETNPMVADAIAAARAEGVLTVWIAGNTYDLSASPLPATALVGSSSPQALVVGSSTQDGRPSTWSRPDPEILARGEEVTVAVRSTSQPYGTGWKGTSFAAPRIAGAAALLIGDGAPRDPDWLEWVLLHEAHDDPEVGYLQEGYGVFDLSALANARAVAQGARPVAGPDARDAFHLASSVARVALTGTPPDGILPP